MSVKIDWQNACKDNKSRVEDLLQKEKITDCQFIVGQESDEAITIRGHKLILAMASPVFEQMFYGSFDDEKSNEIRIQDIKHNVFHKMMDYIYYGKLELVATEDAIELYSAAKKYILKSLMERCTDYLIANFNLSNVWQIYEFAAFFEEDDVLNKSADWMARNALVVLKHPTFKNANLTTLIALLDRNFLNIGSELDLFHVLNEYALANGYFDTKNSAEDEKVESEIEKKKLLREALKKIRFLSLAPEQFAIVAKSELLTESEVLSILLNKLSPDVTDRPMPEGFSNSSVPRCSLLSSPQQDSKMQVRRPPPYVFSRKKL